ncbi:putative transcriptional regulatory protein PrrA [Bacteroidia bacterium]|nr:putative transcriptional regulatory protein PrrA [Bacteroidia bacterium]
MQKTILIIDDDDALRNSLARGLKDAGFVVLTAGSAEDGTEILKRIAADAIVLDRMMGRKDGLTAMREWRAAGDLTPVLMLTAMSGAENAIAGLEGGADDYLAKPFQLRELILRLNRIMRESAKKTGNLPSGMLLIENEFWINNKLLALSLAEHDLLRALTSPIGAAAAAAPMVAKRLRAKLSAALPGIEMMTVRGRGYKIVVKSEE